MPLTRVTITGADDHTPISELHRLSRLYPFVEWGILAGGGAHVGSERFPSREWCVRLTSEARYWRPTHPLHLALHICGEPLRALCRGDLGAFRDRFELEFLRQFGRFQLNFHGLNHDTSGLSRLLRELEAVGLQPEIIFQLDGVNDHLVTMECNFARSGLFDLSHGAGVLPACWPAPHPALKIGYAGGIGPHNVESVLDDLGAICEPDRKYWIDMETHVRTCGHLDMQKVEAVLETCAKRINPNSPTPQDRPAALQSPLTTSDALSDDDATELLHAAKGSICKSSAD